MDENQNKNTKNTKYKIKIYKNKYLENYKIYKVSYTVVWLLVICAEN